MIDFDAVVKHEEMKDVVLFLIGKKNEGMSHPSLDRFFNIHKASDKYDTYNIQLIAVVQDLMGKGEIVSGYKKGPNWKEPDFVTQKKYGIE